MTLGLYRNRSAEQNAQGDNEKALSALQKALDTGFRGFAALDASSYFSQLRSGQRYQQLIQRYRR